MADTLAGVAEGLDSAGTVEDRPTCDPSSMAFSGWTDFLDGSSRTLQQVF